MLFARRPAQAPARVRRPKERPHRYRAITLAATRSDRCTPGSTASPPREARRTRRTRTRRSPPSPSLYPSCRRGRSCAPPRCAQRTFRRNSTPARPRRGPGGASTPRSEPDPCGAAAPPRANRLPMLMPNLSPRRDLAPAGYNGSVVGTILHHCDLRVALGPGTRNPVPGTLVYYAAFAIRRPLRNESLARLARM